MLAASRTIVAPTMPITVAASLDTTDTRSTSDIPSNARASQLSMLTRIRARRADGSVMRACRIVERKDADGHCRAVAIPHGAAVWSTTRAAAPPLVLVVAPPVVAVPAVVVILVPPVVFPVAVDVSPA
jgi:hypothetical protein